MKYGFIIDNRKCIGCHACTTACKAEHEVPVGVNRTWVKQVEKGEFPETRRLFSVMRCNHCTDAPCVEICPTEALFFRDDGIVDFDKDRCIGCKSCMQACPYDALYIDPETHTAAKCNYCAHRIDLGLEPACVNVCPEHAIISGDMEDSKTEIFQLLSKHSVKIRKPEKGIQPNLFYIDADDVSLVPSSIDNSDISLWGSQSLGVGHYAAEAEKLAFSNGDILAEAVKLNSRAKPDRGKMGAPRTVEIVMNKARTVYDSPDKGILWGWEVSAYIWTKSVSTGAFLVPFIAWAIGKMDFSGPSFWIAIVAGLIFLGLTGILLIMDLDRPDRFFYVLLRPHWKSWLVKGGYSITIYGGLLSTLALCRWFGFSELIPATMWLTALVATLVSIYTAYLFAQAKGRDFWQSPALSIHMLVHSFMTGASLFLIIHPFLQSDAGWKQFLIFTLMTGIMVNLITILVELTTTHPTVDTKTTIYMITRGQYSKLFWTGVILAGNFIPLALLGFNYDSNILLSVASILVLSGIYITEHIWIEAPQRIPLS